MVHTVKRQLATNTTIPQKTASANLEDLEVRGTVNQRPPLPQRVKPQQTLNTRGSINILLFLALLPKTNTSTNFNGAR